MITLKSLLYRAGIEAVVGSTQATINEIEFDSLRMFQPCPDVCLVQQEPGGLAAIHLVVLVDFLGIAAQDPEVHCLEHEHCVFKHIPCPEPDFVVGWPCDFNGAERSVGTPF